MRSAKEFQSLCLTHCFCIGSRVLTPGSSYSEFSWSIAGKTGDSVFVRSSDDKGPHMCYTHVRELHPFCMRPRSLEPSFEDLPVRCAQELTNDFVYFGSHLTVHFFTACAQSMLRALPCASSAVALDEKSRKY